MTILLHILFISCDDNEDMDSSPLVGTWVETNTSSETWHITFNSNGSGVWAIYNYSQLEDQNDFTWSTKDNTVYMSFSDGFQDSYQYDVSGSVLVLRWYDTDDREPYSYKLVKHIS